jgi:hypothetical protein
VIEFPEERRAVAFERLEIRVRSSVRSAILAITNPKVP